jgi:hypothetical protein
MRAWWRLWVCGYVCNAVHYGEKVKSKIGHIVRIILLCVGAIFMVGCASIVNETSHSMRVETVTPDGQLVAGADCSFTNDYAATSGKSGGGVSVRRSSRDLDIVCALPGQHAATGRAVSRGNAGLAGNIIFGGGVGAIIDHNKGTAYTYPTWIRLVFGQLRTFDRRDEKDGTAVLGTLVGAPSLAATVAPSTPQPVAATVVAAPHSVVIATGYARIDDVDAIPFINDRGRQSYRDWLTKSTPRAFAISATGGMAASVGLKPVDETLPSDPVVRAVVACNRQSKTPCRLYAVNGSVVWPKDAAPAP